MKLNFLNKGADPPYSVQPTSYDYDAPISGLSNRNIKNNPESRYLNIFKYLLAGSPN